MKKLETLTQEQKNNIPVYFQKWNEIAKNYKPIDREKAKTALTKYLALSDIKTKYFLFLNSPMACQLGINLLKNLDNSQLDSQLRSQLDNQLRSQLYSQLDSQLDSQLRNQLDSQLDSQLRSQLRSQLDNQLYSQLYNQLDNQLDSQLDNQLDNQLYSQLRSQLDSQLDSQLRSQLDNQLRSQLYNQLYSQLYSQNLKDIKLEYFITGWFSQSGNINSGYCAFYDYVESNLKSLDEKTKKIWETFKEVSSELHYFFVFKDFVFASEKPKEMHFKANNLHGENKPAILYPDGYCLYSWNGITVSEQLIMRSETITKKDILSIDNAEVRRCYMEKLGAKKYYDILSDGKGLKLIDSCIDNQNNVMKLWETVINDDIINKKVQFLECECPSTHRIYNIYPPNQKSKTCQEAKYSTFLNIKGKYRQGDVMLQEISKDYDLCLVET